MTRGAFGQPIDTRAMLTAVATRPRRGDCPDCNAHGQMVQHAPGVWILEIHHDDTCPAWRAMRGQS